MNAKKKKKHSQLYALRVVQMNVNCWRNVKCQGTYLTAQRKRYAAIIECIKMKIASFT